jgi:hypothetical protein
MGGHDFWKLVIFYQFTHNKLSEGNKQEGPDRLQSMTSDPIVRNPLLSSRVWFPYVTAGFFVVTSFTIISYENNLPTESPMEPSTSLSLPKSYDILLFLNWPPTSILPQSSFK